MIEIEHQDAGSKGRYVYSRDGLEAELTYVKVDAGAIIVDHTFVPPVWRGEGIAAKLVEHVVADARSRGFRIRPVCPYVVTAFKRHPEWADVLA